MRRTRDWKYSCGSVGVDSSGAWGAVADGERGCARGSLVDRRLVGGRATLLLLLTLGRLTRLLLAPLLLTAIASRSRTRHAAPRT